MMSTETIDVFSNICHYAKLTTHTRCWRISICCEQIFQMLAENVGAEYVERFRMYSPIKDLCTSNKTIGTLSLCVKLLLREQWKHVSTKTT